MFQELSIIGNVSSEPIKRTLANGVVYAVFTVAVNKRITLANGEKTERTTWFRCTAWRHLAETVSEFVHKSNKVFVQGEIEAPRAYLDARNQEPRANLEVTINLVKFLDNRPDGPSAATEPALAGMPALDGAAPF